MSVLHLGHQELTGVFFRARVKSGLLPVHSAGLVPRERIAAAEALVRAWRNVGENYGLSLWLNQSMVQHLADKVRYLERLNPPASSDVVLDIAAMMQPRSRALLDRRPKAHRHRSDG